MDVYIFKINAVVRLGNFFPHKTSIWTYQDSQNFVDKHPEISLSFVCTYCLTIPQKLQSETLLLFLKIKTGKSRNSLRSSQPLCVLYLRTIYAPLTRITKRHHTLAAHAGFSRSILAHFFFFINPPHTPLPPSNLTQHRQSTCFDHNSDCSPWKLMSLRIIYQKEKLANMKEGRSQHRK